jgi:hypothetical protein
VIRRSKVFVFLILVGDFYPQSFIWKFSIALHAFPRYFISFIYYKKYFSCKRVANIKLYNCCLYIAFMFNFMEITALLTLTFISSTEYHDAHVAAFIVFLISSTFYMVLICLSYSFEIDLNSKYDHSNAIKSKRHKIYLFLVYSSSFFISLYFYLRHNIHCEPYMFSFFSLFEYVTVISNITFHIQIFYDLNLLSTRYKICLIDPNSQKAN